MSAATNRKSGPRSGGAARSAPTTLPPLASSRSAVARPIPDATPVTTNVRDLARSTLIMAGPLEFGCPQSESELVIDDAQPDLCDVHCHLLADERVLGAGVDVTECALEAATLADRGGP